MKTYIGLRTDAGCDVWVIDAQIGGVSVNSLDPMDSVALMAADAWDLRLARWNWGADSSGAHRLALALAYDLLAHNAVRAKAVRRLLVRSLVASMRHGFWALDQEQLRVSIESCERRIREELADHA
jgi:hypothetical protein